MILVPGTLQAELIEPSEINQEISDSVQVDVTETGAQSLPYQSLTPDQFERLLWDLFHSDIETEPFYDYARLMIIGADKGRDVWLTCKEIPVGLVQCKREAGKFGLPATLREIIKFLLYAEIDNTLLPKEKEFTFYLALSNDPQGDVDGFFNTPKAWFKAHESEIEKHSLSVQGKYTSLKEINVKEVMPKIIEKLKALDYKLLRPHELDRLLNIRTDVRDRHFRTPDSVLATHAAPITPKITQEDLNQASRQLACWQKTIDSKLIDRPELDELERLISREESCCYLLTGSAGSGKSSLLSELYKRLSEKDLTILAIKADELEVDINDLNDLAKSLKLESNIVSSLLELSVSKPLVLLIDQMDAVSEVMDQSSNRFRVLVDLIMALKGQFESRKKHPIHIIVSSRAFEASFDTRFTQLEAERIDLQLPSKEQIEELLTDIGIDVSTVLASMYPTIQVPFALNLYVSLVKAGCNSVEITSKNLLHRWLEKKLSNSTAKYDQLEFLRLLAHDMVQHEVLRRPLAAYQLDYGTTINALEASGILVRYEQNIGFSHQAWLDDFQAQSFKCSVDICYFIWDKQDGLFSRSTILRGLEHLREHDYQEYQLALDTLLFNGKARRHILHLLIDILASSPLPDFLDAERVQRLLSYDEVLARRLVSKIAVNWLSWRELLVEYIPELMKQSDRYRIAIEWLVPESQYDENHVFSLIGRLWSDKKYDESSFNVLVRSTASTSTAIAYAETVISRSDIYDSYIRSYITELFKQDKVQPALRVLMSKLKQLDDNKALEYRMHGFETFAKKFPLECAEALMPWFINILEKDKPKSTISRSLRRSQNLPFDWEERSENGNLLTALQMSLNLAAKNNSPEFMSFARPFMDIQLDEAQSLIATAFAHNAKMYSLEILEYLLSDVRRYQLGDSYFNDENNVSFSVRGSCSIMLIEEAIPHWNSKQIEQIRLSIESFQAYRPESTADVTEKKNCIRYSEEYRLTLLARLPTEALEPRRRRQVKERDCRYEPTIGERSRGMGMASVISSPMSAEQMSKSDDEDILNLLNEISDSKDENSLRRRRFGGVVELSRAFGEFTESNPMRAIDILYGKFTAGVHEYVAAQAIQALSKSNHVDSLKLKKLIKALNQRGFNSKEWLHGIANAFQQIAKTCKGLNDQDIKYLISCLCSEHDTDEQLDYNVKNNKSFLFGSNNGSRTVPSGNYTLMSAIYHGLLYRESPCYDQWVDILCRFLDISNNRETWKCILLFEGRQLYWANEKKINYFIERLLATNPAVFSEPSIVITIWKINSKLDDSLLNKVIEYWLAEGSPALVQVAGELISGLIIIGSNNLQIKGLQKNKLAEGDVNFKQGVIYSACSGWYELGKTRGNSHKQLMSCLNGELESLDCALNSLFSFQKRMPNDELTLEVLSLIADNPSLIDKLDKYRLISSLVKLNPTPRLMKVVLQIAQQMVKIQQVNKGPDNLYFEHSDELVQLAVTLQRSIGPLKQDAMSLYETLLDAGVYQAEAAAEAALRPH
jgi:hypothetical protein